MSNNVDAQFPVVKYLTNKKIVIYSQMYLLYRLPYLTALVI